MARTIKVLWTIGYDGETVEGLVGRVNGHGIEVLVDVRELPLSRKKGLSKRSLAAKLGEEGLEYRHMKALGAPKEVRKPYLSGGSFESFKKGYLEHLSGQKDALEDLVELASKRRTILLCYEADARRCHRQFVAGRLKRRGFEVRHV